MSSFSQEEVAEIAREAEMHLSAIERALSRSSRWIV
jgi:hypothetical protein